MQSQRINLFKQLGKFEGLSGVTGLTGRLGGMGTIFGGWAAVVALGFVPSWAAAQQEHVVQPGETLWRISQQYQGDARAWPLVSDRNSLSDPHRIYPGMRLRVSANVLTSHVHQVHGLAWLQRDGQAQLPVAKEMPIAAGDTLLTQRNSFLSLQLQDGSLVVVPSNSAVRVQSVQPGAIKLKLLQGRVESYVRPPDAKQRNQGADRKQGSRFEVQTRYINLGVKGTHFRVGDEQGVVTAGVIEGVVQGNGVVSGQSQSSTEINSQSSSKGRRTRLDPVPSIQYAQGEGGAFDSAEQAAAKLLAGQRQTMLPAPQLAPTPVVRADGADGAGQQGAATDTAFVLQIAPLAGAVRYRVQLARDQQFLNLFWEGIAPASPSAGEALTPTPTPKSLPDSPSAGAAKTRPEAMDSLVRLNLPVQAHQDTPTGGFVHARLTAVDASGLEGLPKDYLIFLGAPAQLAQGPALVKAVGGARLALSWPTQEGAVYTVRISRDPQAQLIVLEVPYQTSGQINFGPLVAAGTYFWQVLQWPQNAINSGGLASATKAGDVNGDLDKGSPVIRFQGQFEHPAQP